MSQPMPRLTSSLALCVILSATSCALASGNEDESRAALELMDRIQGIGGRVVFEFESFDGSNPPASPPARSTVESYLRRTGRGSRSIVFVELSGNAVHNQDLLLLRGLTELRGIRIACPNVDETGLSVLGDLEQLQQLWLEQVRLSSGTLPALSKLHNLRLLNVDALPLRNSAVADLRGLSRLRVLHLNSPEIGDAALPSLAKLPALELLGISGSAATGAGLTALHEARVLHGLVLSPRQLDAAGRSFVKEAKGLKELWIVGGILPKTDEEDIRTSRPDLRLFGGPIRI